MRVPIGSSLADLDHLMIRGVGSVREVVEWVRIESGPPPKKPVHQNEFGTFVFQPRGDYGHWKKSRAERHRFTGEITFIHHGSTSSDISTLIYIDGKLKKADWGFLPG